MRIAISGAHGLIGGTLVREFTKLRDYEITRLRRGQVEGLDGHDVVVHLAGEPLVGVWTSAKKRAIRESRVPPTSLLATSLGRLTSPPKVFICASAVGYYGDRGDSVLDETSAKGTGFLADTAEAWEAATAPAQSAGIRTVSARFGLVLSRDGGALGPILPVFKSGIGGKLGSGRQFWSWVSIDDVVGSLTHMIATESLFGPVNVVAPQPVTNLAFTRTLGRVLRRPTIFGVPAVLLRTVGGEMAKEMLLSSARVVPRKLQASGYGFKYPELEAALRHVLAEG